MITEALIAVFVGLLTFLGDLLPDMDTPAWVASISTHVSTVTADMAALGAWLPFGAAGNATLLVLAALAAAALIRLVRMALSLFTGGGGA